MGIIAQVIVEQQAPFQWGPYILAAIGLGVAIFGFAFKRVLNTLDITVSGLQTVVTDVAVIKQITSGTIEARLKALEEDKRNG